ncbi:thioredoxin family protein [Nocardioides sp.]|uniref:thioredoxin family protein n=1 Tax=Nocardioides sp. TaxID=35761 RepID=UPI00271BF6D0|nr:thioredoxin family protein [Nocardioides sp.]MDO9454967.1 thioredoxin family protein [Nocardioides sp.]
MTTGAWVAIAAVATAVAFGLWRRRTDGRFGESEEQSVQSESVLAGTPWQDELGERATLLQFSSAFCAPCRTTRVVLADVARAEGGVKHVEVDAEQHLDVVRRLGIMRTPTTVVLDPLGRELGRAAGAPTKEQVLQSLPD